MSLRILLHRFAGHALATMCPRKMRAVDKE